VAPTPAGSCKVEAERAIALFGTAEPVEAPLRLVAGPLAADLQDGSLRDVRFRGREMIRGIAFLVRDARWGTYRPSLSGLVVRQEADRFEVVYRASVFDARQRLSWEARIAGRADGSLAFEVEAVPGTPFETNRTGFVVLHPILGVAGRPAGVETVDGERRLAAFPDGIDPAQPFMDLRALTHAFAGDLAVTCRMEGDAYETEDQRNWLDASFKTYIRPLSKPWPYTLAAGEPLRQRVVLSVHEVPPRAFPDWPAGQGNVADEPGRDAPAGVMPRLGYAVEPVDADETSEASTLLRQAGAAHVVASWRNDEGRPLAQLSTLLQAAAQTGSEVWLELMAKEIEDVGGELSSLAGAVASAGVSPGTVLVSPVADLRSTPPSQPWPPAPPLDRLYAAARHAFPGARLGGGMASTFTELNRKRPPHRLIDLATFTTASIVHAADDRSVMEGLEALPAMLRSARAFLGNTPLHVGPSAIGMRLNPYGPGTSPNPDGRRIPMARRDPRQRGLFGAAWMLAYVAILARKGVPFVTLGGGTGDFGLVERAGDGWVLRPVFHVFRGLARLAGRTLVGSPLAAPEGVASLAVGTAEGTECWLANLSPAPAEISLPGGAGCRVLDAASWKAASEDPAWMDSCEHGHAGPLDVHAVARIIVPRRDPAES
jgi:D-apionolactonase